MISQVTDGSQINDREVGVNQVYPLEQNNLLRIGIFVLTVDYQVTQSPSAIEQSAVALSQPHQWNGGELTVRCLQAIAPDF